MKLKGMNQNEDSLTTCAWHKDSKKFVAGGTRGHFYQIVRRIYTFLAFDEFD